MGKDKKYIEIDSSAIRQKILVSGIAVFLLCLVVSLLFSSLFNYTNLLELIVITVLWVSFMLMWAITSILAWTKWRKNKYILTDDSLVVVKSGFFSTTEQFYRYDSFLSIEVKQTIAGKKSGKIIITIPKMEQKLVLNNIKNPRQQAEYLKSQIVQNSPDTKSLIN